MLKCKGILLIFNGNFVWKSLSVKMKAKNGNWFWKLAEKPPLLHQAVTSSVSCWPSGVKYSIPVIWVRVSEGATHTSFEVWEQASFKGYFISLVVICVK